MKDYLVAASVAVLLAATFQHAAVAAMDNVEAQCRKYAKEDEVSEAEMAEYMQTCLALAESGAEPMEDPAPAGEAPQDKP